MNSPGGSKEKVQHLREGSRHGLVTGFKVYRNIKNITVSKPQKFSVIPFWRYKRVFFVWSGGQIKPVMCSCTITIRPPCLKEQSPLYGSTSATAGRQMASWRKKVVLCAKLAYHTVAKGGKHDRTSRRAIC